MAKKMTRDELNDLYDFEFDGTHGEVKIGTLTFSASRVYRLCDNDGYRLAVNDYADAHDIEML